jgi:hypothetical protein
VQTSVIDEAVMICDEPKPFDAPSHERIPPAVVTGLLGLLFALNAGSVMAVLLAA